jgi:tRNA(Ile)-lysidine synthase
VDEVRRFLVRVAVSGPGVVAVSGGADSVALLRALVAVGAGPLTVAHFNHRLRGADSDADATFVAELAASLGLPFRLGSADVAAVAAGDNLEATARRLRYGWLAEVAASVGAAWIATGHTADDQAETVLHRLIRGTGLQGLRGIAVDQDFRAGGVSPLSATGLRGLTPPARLIRPLLTVTRAGVLTYLGELNQPFREDASNADPRFTRNRIRAELLPLLRTFNPDVVSALARLADQAAEAHAVIAEQAGSLVQRAELPRAGETVILDAAALTAAPRLVVRSALRLVWEREGWPTGDMGFDAWERAVEVATGTAGGCDFPGGIAARHRGRVVQIGRAS